MHRLPIHAEQLFRGVLGKLDHVFEGDIAVSGDTKALFVNKVVESFRRRRGGTARFGQEASCRFNGGYHLFRDLLVREISDQRDLAFKLGCPREQEGDKTAEAEA